MESCDEKSEETTGCLLVQSPFRNNVNLFNNKKMFPDMELVVPGLEDPLLLHKGVMANTSKLMQGLLNAKQTAKSPEESQIEWMFDAKNDMDRSVLVKVLRFCYDGAMTVNAEGGELCAVVATLCRLQVGCLEKVLEKLTEYAVEQAGNDVKIGAELLKSTLHYPECRCPKTCELDKELAEVVLTATNICENYDVVVSDCLMKLPAQYLDHAEYGDPHTKFSEFSVRVRYIREHDSELSKSDKEEILLKCDWTKLQSAELKELRSLDIVRQELMTEICDKVLETTEKESEFFKPFFTQCKKKRYSLFTDDIYLSVFALFIP